MVIYHGSDVAVITPKILDSNRFLDFGKGFYTTSSHEQAVRWAQRVCDGRNSEQSIISVYNFDLEKAETDLHIIKFNEPTPEWLHFVVACRSGNEGKYRYDAAIGPVANDNVYETIRLFETGVFSEQETIIRLRIIKIYNQILFHTEQALDYCIFTKQEIIKGALNE